nr:immunoglobulin heavy chain junction region [Mus musculus]
CFLNYYSSRYWYFDVW